MKKKKGRKESESMKGSETALIMYNRTFLLRNPKGSLDNVQEFFYANRLAGGVGIVTLNFARDFPDDVLFEIWPGSAIIVDCGDDILQTIMSPDRDPEQFIVCPKCGAYWRKRTEQPKQCPICHRVLTKYSLEDLTLKVPDGKTPLRVLLERPPRRTEKAIVETEKTKEERLGGIFQL